MITVINIVQIILSLTLIVILLLQMKGEGLSGAFGSDSPVAHQRRGLEATLYNITVALAAIFMVLSIASALAPRFFQ